MQKIDNAAKLNFVGFWVFFEAETGEFFATSILLSEPQSDDDDVDDDDDDGPLISTAEAAGMYDIAPAAAAEPEPEAEPEPVAEPLSDAEAAGIYDAPVEGDQ